MMMIYSAFFGEHSLKIISSFLGIRMRHDFYPSLPRRVIITMGTRGRSHSRAVTEYYEVLYSVLPVLFDGIYLAFLQSIGSMTPQTS